MVSMAKKQTDKPEDLGLSICLYRLQGACTPINAFFEIIPREQSAFSDRQCPASCG